MLVRHAFFKTVVLTSKRTDGKRPHERVEDRQKPGGVSGSDAKVCKVL